MSDHRASRSPGPESPARQVIASSACTICRTRKIKCDRIKPNCTACSNYPNECKYEPRKKRSPGRSKYNDMADRLAIMESLVKEASRGKGLTPPGIQFSDFDSIPGPETPVNARCASPDLSGLVLEEDKLVNASNRTFPGNNLSGQSGPESHFLSSTATCVDKSLDAEYSGSFTIFSPPCIRWINELVGDDSFARAVAALQSPSPSANNGTIEISSIHPLPSKKTTIECTKEYLAGINHVAHLFDDQEILNGIERYYSTGKIPSRSWFIAINVILAHVFREKGDAKSSFECEKYMGNAMSMVSSVLMSEPNPLNAGAMLSLALYFSFLRKSQTAIMILGAAVQLMILGGYHTARSRRGQTDLDKLRERRLFWQAFVLDHDLALRVGKPPIIGLELVGDLPPNLPDDGRGTTTFADGTTLDILREHVALAKIKSKVYSRLYAKHPMRCAQEDANAIFDLDSELYAWKRKIPDLNQVNISGKKNKDPGLISLTILHYTYYQVLIVLHLFVFQFPILSESDENFGTMLSSGALCVGAARATIALLDFHDDRHPFSMHLLNDVSWSLDIVFINTLQNKGDISAQEDFALLGKVLSIFKRLDPNYMNAISFRIAHIFHRVAWNALQNYAYSVTPPPNKVFPPTDATLSKAWSINFESKAALGEATTLQPLESRQRPFCEQANAPWSVNQSHHHLDTDPTGLGISDSFPSSTLDDDSTSGNGNMDWMGYSPGVMNNEFRLSFGSHPQDWEEFWNTVAVTREEEI